MATAQDRGEFIEQCYIPEPNTGCWLWTGTWDKDGYGVTEVGGSRKQIRAHRLAFEYFKGPIPEGLLVCHKCDTRCCINPDHLFLGTTQDNNKDRDRKGRNTRGGKLTGDQVGEIRIAEGSQSLIAAKYGISQALVALIKNRKVWKDLK